MEEGPAATIIAAARPLAARSGGGKESRGGREEGLVEAAAPPVSLRRSDAGAELDSSLAYWIFGSPLHRIDKGKVTQDMMSVKYQSVKLPCSLGL